jgi:hypothetical protein
MKDSNQTVSNKHNSGKGNGNSVIDNHEKTSDYVSGSVPSSTSHKFGASTDDSNSKQQR